jgi:hypothetical protein
LYDLEELASEYDTLADNYVAELDDQYCETNSPDFYLGLLHAYVNSENLVNDYMEIHGYVPNLIKLSSEYHKLTVYLAEKIINPFDNQVINSTSLNTSEEQLGQLIQVDFSSQK